MGNIYIRDARTYNDKINRLKGGNVEVVADFDHTITASRRVSASCFGLLASMTRVDSQFGTDRSALFAEYHPHEMNPVYSKEERDFWMEQWWRKAMELHAKHGVKVSDIATIDYKRAVMRSGWREFLDFCRENTIPVHVLSAGITQIIESILTQNEIQQDGIDITSNQLLFDTEGNYLGSHPLAPIHTGNKSVHRSPKTDRIILLGDSLDDVYMAGDVEEENVLKIAFHNPESSITPDAYLEVFDVVVESGSTDLGFLGTLEEQMV